MLVGVLPEQLHGDALVGEAGGRELAADFGRGLGEDRFVGDEVVDRQVGPIAAARFAEGERVERNVFGRHPPRGDLRRQIVRRDGPLGAVAQQQHAEHAAAGVAVEHVADRGAERGLLAGRRGRQLDLAVLDLRAARSRCRSDRR